MHSGSNIVAIEKNSGDLFLRILSRPQKDVDGKYPQDIVAEFFVYVLHDDRGNAGKQWHIDDFYLRAKNPIGFSQYYDDLRGELLKSDRVLLTYPGHNKGNSYSVGYSIYNKKTFLEGQRLIVYYVDGRWKILRSHYW